jgi:hypothetical protein
MVICMPHLVIMRLTVVLVSLQLLSGQADRRGLAAGDKEEALLEGAVFSPLVPCSMVSPSSIILTFIIMDQQSWRCALVGRYRVVLVENGFP